jgi:rhodanese-related sulfurtransferase/polyisoprenoid-binding protein YceI
VGHFITSEDLKSWIDSGTEFILVDVLPEEYYDEKHLPNAKNACVHETGFLSRVDKLAPDKNIPIVVYGSSARSNAAAAAANKLIDSGYSQVLHFPGGTEEWQHRRFPVEGDLAGELPASVDRTALPLEARKSRALWIDRDVDNQHFGTMKIFDGHLELAAGAVVGGRLLIDMTSLKCTDIASEPLNRTMVDQMKSREFFDVLHYPTAELVLTRVVQKHSDANGDWNTEIMANLTLKGLTNELEFAGHIGTLDGGALAFQAHFDIDRDKWPNVYGADGMADIVAGRLADDYITLQLSVFTRPVA